MALGQYDESSEICLGICVRPAVRGDDWHCYVDQPDKKLGSSQVPDQYHYDPVYVISIVDVCHVDFCVGAQRRSLRAMEITDEDILFSSDRHIVDKLTQAG